MKKFIAALLVLALTVLLGCHREKSSTATQSVTLPGGRHYVGQMLNGKPNGQGTLTAGKNNRYVGEFVDGRIEGHGKLYLPDGSIYEGEFKNNLINGHGTIVAPDGTRYEGEWKDGKMNGKGTFTYPDGRQESGYFDMGKYIGKEPPKAPKSFPRGKEREVRPSKNVVDFRAGGEWRKRTADCLRAY